ncbi:MAG: hypothetical protein ACLGSA_02705 [Acidobacteriota bacterium]
MKKATPVLVSCVLAVAALLSFVAAPVCLAQSAPLEIAGFKLGDDVKARAQAIDEKKSEVDINRQYLTTVLIKPVAGYRSGYVTYGNCAAPGRISRVKMNYENDSREFYEKLLAALKKRYGEPQQWRGNPFGTLRIWKWSLKDKALGDISVILQHYSGEDDSFTKGNSIRIAAADLLEQERDCWRAKHPGEKIQAPDPTAAPQGIEYYLPR